MLLTRFKFWLVVGLLIANLTVGIVSLYFLRSVNQRYAVQFENGIPVITSFHGLSRELNAVQRLARQISDAEIDVAGSDLLVQMDDLSDNAKAHALEISRRDLLKDTPHAKAIVAISREYDEKTDRLRILAEQQRLIDAKRYNLETLRPCYDRYQSIIDAAAAQVEQQDSGLRNQYAKDSRFFGGLALAFTGWPLLVALLALLTLGLLVLVLLVTILTPVRSWRSSVPPPI